MTEHLQTNDRPNIQTYALSLQTFTIFFLINAFINVFPIYYNFFDVYHIYGYECEEEESSRWWEQLQQNYVRKACADTWDSQQLQSDERSLRDGTYYHYF